MDAAQQRRRSGRCGWGWLKTVNLCGSRGSICSLLLLHLARACSLLRLCDLGMLTLHHACFRWWTPYTPHLNHADYRSNVRLLTANYLPHVFQPAGLGWLSVGCVGRADFRLWTLPGVAVTIHDALVPDYAKEFQKPGFSRMLPTTAPKPPKRAPGAGKRR